VFVEKNDPNCDDGLAGNFSLFGKPFVIGKLLFSVKLLISVSSSSA
jgi:hypothetical protein